ncbi:MAG: GDP-L-fucose synthase family protein [Bacteroidales bacterium]
MQLDEKIFVAGHRGLVGSALLKNLQARGYRNFVLRTYKELDLTNQQAVADFFSKEKPAYVFLAAAHVGGILANLTDRADFIYNNLQIQNNVIYQSWKHGVKKLLFLGSTCIYPKQAPQPMPEDCLLTGTLEYTNEPYALAKIAGLNLCESFNLQYGTNFIAVMPTNLYGPNDNFDLEKSHVLPALIRKAHLGKLLMQSDWDGIRSDLDRLPIKGVNGQADSETILTVLSSFGLTPESIEIWGTGKPTREFLWSEDMADACVFVMEHVDFTDVAKGKKEVRNCHINIGTGKEISIADLAELIAQKVGYTGQIRFDASKPDGTMRKLTDPGKLHDLGWKHSVEIDEGIQRIYSWYLS